VAPQGLRTALALAAALAALGACTSTASAVIEHVAGGETISYIPTPAKARGLNGALTPNDQVFSNVDYNGGPVMPSNTNYVIYWAPAGANQYPAGYQSGLDQYFTDLARDSGGDQNTDSVATQYMDASGDFASYRSSFGGAFNDTTPYPASACGAGAVTAGTPCLTDAQLQQELASFVIAHGLPMDPSHEYFLVFPPGVENCVDSNPSNGCSADANRQYAQYCAYHSNTAYTPGAPVIVYANNPYNDDNSCQSGNWNNGPADGLIDGGLNHEHLESLTDPIPATGWVDNATGAGTGYEIADKCQYVYGPPLGGAGTAQDPYYNQIVDGHRYYYQEGWSNQGHGCRQRFTFSGAPAVARFTATPGAGTTMTFDATGSTQGAGVEYHWQFENTLQGFSETESTSLTVSHSYPIAGPHTVSLTVFEPDGTSAATARVITTGATPPEPAFTPAGGNLAQGQPVTFTDTSADPSGRISSESWNFGDGSPTASGPNPTHTFTALGTDTVTLRVTDTLGQTASVSHQFTVLPAPEPAFSVTTAKPLAGSPTAFDGSASSDPSGRIVSYSWNWGDGTAPGSGLAPSHTYAFGGTYTVALTVTDSAGLRAVVSKQLTVAQPPAAAFSVRTKHPATGVAIRFNATSSTSPNGPVVSYAWSFGDRSPLGSGPTPSHKYRTPGTYPVGVTITDSAGFRATIVKMITVVRAARIKRVSVKTQSGIKLLLVKVTGPGRVRIGSKRARLTNSGTAKFPLNPGTRRKLKLQITFTPVAGPVQRKKVTIRFA
jgi:PKD repeat protein